MATFIPERTGVSGARGIQIKRALNGLDDSYVVRTPIRPDVWAPEFFVQHPELGWLALAVSDVPYTALTEGQLFEDSRREEFEQVLARLAALGRTAESGPYPIPRALLMWRCNHAETERLNALYGTVFGVTLLGKDEFAEEGARRIRDLLVPIDTDLEQTLMAEFFPEAEIHPDHTTRGHFRRDNSAQLQKFFLDYQQEWAAKLDLDLALPQEQAEAAKDFSVRLINGVAGSGKTLIAVSRALLLAEMFPDQRILILIHNTPVVADLKAKLLRSRGGIPPNCDIETFSAWVVRQWKNCFGRPPKMKANWEVSKLIKGYQIRSDDLRYSEKELFDELNFINDYVMEDQEQYLSASRTGRGFALRGKEREQVWSLYERVKLDLGRSNQLMWSALPRDVCLAGNAEQIDKYHHIIVDEAQFAAPSWFEVIKLAMEKGGQLFLCADPNQGFLKNRLSWKSVGLDVAGRTKKLQKSYRTTRAILESANAVLARYAKADGEEYLIPDFAEMESGTKPLLVYVDSPQDAVFRLINELDALRGAGYLLGSLLVLTGGRVPKSLLHNQLGARIGRDRLWLLNEQKKEPPGSISQDYLRVASVESATGLEAPAVFIIGIEGLFARLASPPADEDEQAEIEGAARKLYMAMTRAGHRLVVVVSEPLPPDLAAFFKVVQVGSD